jgi:protein-tyrosine-phosphatase/predicted ATP-grasp superfamily ATP-dependent carboligase
MSDNFKYRPVLILGASPRITVPVARSLHRHGIPVEVATFQSEEPRLRSRAIRNFHRLPAKGQPAEFAAALLSLIRETQADMMLAAGDPSLAAMAEHYDQLAPLLHVGCPSPRVVERVLNKSLTLETARRCGIAAPLTCTVTTAAELETVGPKLRFPLVAKPGQKGGPSFHITYFHDLPALSAFLSNRQPGSVLLQEYCPGVGVGVEMLIRNGEPIATFQHRRLKESPCAGGVAVLAIAEAPDRKLAQDSLALLRELQWEGVAMVEFRVDQATGSAMLMEVNGRYWGSSSFPPRAGVDFPFYQWQLAHGEEPRVAHDYAVGMRWRWTPGYIDRLHGVLAGSGASVETKRSRWRELADVPRDLSPWVRDALWSWSDPLPALTELGSTLLRWLKADIKWLVRRLIPKRLLRARDLRSRLGPKAGPIYARLSLMDTMGIRMSNKLTAPPGARSFVFVCHGNIMRSPMAEAMMKHILRDQRQDGFSVLSAGLHATPGREAHPWAQLVSHEIGIPLTQHHAQLLTPEMVADADAILAMDFLNKAELVALYPQAGQKIFMLSAYAEPPLRYREIPDPFYGDVEATRRCYRLLMTCVHNLVKSLSLAAEKSALQHAPVER